jgi:hypothetical protein
VIDRHERAFDDREREIDARLVGAERRDDGDTDVGKPPVEIEPLDGHAIGQHRRRQYGTPGRVPITAHGGHPEARPRRSTVPTDVRGPSTTVNRTSATRGVAGAPVAGRSVATAATPAEA